MARGVGSVDVTSTEELETWDAGSLGVRPDSWCALVADERESSDGADGLGETGRIDRFDSIELIKLGEGPPPNFPSVVDKFDIGCAAVTMTSRLDFRELLRLRCSRGLELEGGSAGEVTPFESSGSTCRTNTSIHLSLSLSLSAQSTCRVPPFFACSMIKKACLKLRSSTNSDGRF